MSALIRRLMAGPLGPYMQFVGLLLLVAVGLFGFVAVFGCGSSPAVEPFPWAPANRARPQMTGITSMRPQQTVTRSLQSIQVGETPPDTVTFTWSPPPGATSFQFPFASLPDNVDSGPPFVWSNLSWAEAQVAREVSYVAPSLPTGWDAYPIFDALEVRDGVGASSTATLWSTVTMNSGDAAGAAIAQNVGEERQGALRSGLSAETCWSVTRWLDPAGPLNTSTCNQLIAPLIGGQAFVALKVPGAPAAEANRSQPLPLIQDGAHDPMMTFVVYGQGDAYESEVVLKPERLGFLASALPTEPGDQWLALGLPADAPACAGNAQAPAGGWSIKNSAFLDLSNRLDNGEGLVLETYYCYEGQDVPPDVGLMGSPLASPAGMRSYQGQGITCIGPQYQTLRTSPDWLLMGSSHETITPTQRLEFHHFVEKTGGGTLQLSLDVTSTLDVGWQFYGGDWDHPQMSGPLGDTLTVDETIEHLWLVSDPVPAGTAWGPYLTVVSASLAGDEQRQSDMVWVGEWVAPPTEPPAATEHTVALPLIIQEE